MNAARVDATRLPATLCTHFFHAVVVHQHLHKVPFLRAVAALTQEVPGWRSDKTMEVPREAVARMEEPRTRTEETGHVGASEEEPEEDQEFLYIVATRFSIFRSAWCADLFVLTPQEMSYYRTRRGVGNCRPRPRSLSLPPPIAAEPRRASTRAPENQAAVLIVLSSPPAWFSPGCSPIATLLRLEAAARWTTGCAPLHDVESDCSNRSTKE